MRARQAHVLFSYSQISQYLRCPRSYRYRYLDGWEERESRPAKAFGRSFEKALAAYFSGDDGGAVFFKEWAASRDAPFEYKTGETWDRLFHQGIRCLNDLRRRIEFGLARRRRTCKLSCFESFRATTNLSPTLMPLAQWMASVGSSTGRPRRAVTWRHLRTCCHWIPSSFVIPG